MQHTVSALQGCVKLLLMWKIKSLIEICSVAVMTNIFFLLMKKKIFLKVYEVHTLPPM